MLLPSLKHHEFKGLNIALHKVAEVSPCKLRFHSYLFTPKYSMHFGLCFAQLSFQLKLIYLLNERMGEEQP